MPENTAFEETVGGVTQRFILDGDAMHVQHTEDAQNVIDAVAKANSHGTTEVEGLGRLICEVPITVAMEFCQRRGIPWQKFMYGSEYDAEFKRFVSEHSKLAYDKPRG